MAKQVGLSTHIWNNNIRCIFLLAFYPVLIIGMFWIIVAALGVTLPQASSDGLNWPAITQFANNITFEYWPLIITGVSIWFTIAWFFNTRMIRKLAHSNPVTRKEEPELYNLVENLCISQGMSVPHLEIIETHARNAFASGITQGNFAVTITRGLMNSLSKDELEAVIAHELTHIQNRDVRLLIVTIIFTGLFGFLAQMVWSNLRYTMFYGRGRSKNKGSMIMAMIVIAVILWLGYMATLLMRFALSRSREYMADAGAIAMTKNPEAMMRALMRISGRDRIPETTDDIAMMCIENHKPFMGMFATHPPIEQRIEAISEVTNTPIPDKSNLAPVNKDESFSHVTSEKSKRSNPWLIRQRRG